MVHVRCSDCTLFGHSVIATVARIKRVTFRSVAEDDAMEVEEFDEIEKLQHQGINAGDIKKLKDAGVHTIQGLQMIPRRVRSANCTQKSQCKRWQVVTVTEPGFDRTLDGLML